MRISTGTIVRTLALALALLNQVLISSGKNPLPWSDSEIYEIISTIVTVVITIIAWWKNNSFTKHAIAGDDAKEAVKMELSNGRGE